MRYLDTGQRDPAQSLGRWLQGVLDDHVVELRWQSGFFTADGLGFFAPTLERLRAQSRTVAALLGANEGATLRADVEILAQLIGVPRPNGHLGIVSYGGAYFHPKTYHVRRDDGSQTAYVGSANLTSPGLSSLHIEAGIILDTRDGDAEPVVTSIAAAIDWWFEPGRVGFGRVDGPVALDQMVADRVLALARPPRIPPPVTTPTGAAITPRPRLTPLIAIPVLVLPAPPPAIGVPGIPLPVTLKAGFPSYLLFDPAAHQPTSGAAALTGTPLPASAVGLVIRLNRDSARHFAGGAGTANISIPVNTLSTLRFGLFHGKYERPRAEFDLRARYLSGAGAIGTGTFETNVMGYGFIAGESGHGDVRMLVPAAIKALRAAAAAQGRPAPADGDFAFLEWPTAASPEFRLSLLERGSPLFLSAEGMFNAAAAAGQLVGDGACWLPPAVAPPW